MAGTGLTFAVGVGAVGTVVGLIATVVGKLTAIDLVQSVVRLSVVAFIIGVLFSAALAIIARAKTFEKLSLPKVTAIGIGGGLLYFGFLAVNGGRRWSTPDAIANLTILVLMGGVSAAGTLLLARRAGRALGAGDAHHRLNESPMSTSDSDVRAQQAPVHLNDEH